MKTIGIYQLEQKKFTSFEFEDIFFNSFGKPEQNFVCTIIGKSGNGKTDFCVKFAKYLSKYERVLYLSAEEGISSTIQIAFNRNNMNEVAGRVILGEKATFDSLVVYLSKKASPKIVFIDSLDYLKLTTDQFKFLRSKFPKKAFVIVSWSDRSAPKSQSAKDIQYMADIKIFIDGYVAFPKSRYGGNNRFIIWEEKAKETYPMFFNLPVQEEK